MGRFNPRPPSLTGEHRDMQRLSPAPSFQSTPAIADGRTVRRFARTAHAASFNPRPPSLTGEPAAQLVHAIGRDVSIHARHR